MSIILYQFQAFWTALAAWYKKKLILWNRIEQPLLSQTEFVEEFPLPKHEENLKRISLFSTKEAFWVHKVTATTKKK